MSPSRARILAYVLALFPALATGCGDDLPIDGESAIATSSTGSSSSSTGYVDPIYDVARLEVYQPQSASIYELGQPLRLFARVEDPDGANLSVDDAAWFDAADDSVLLDQLDGYVELPAGVYELGAVANLPNGDRLQSTVGGVRVQARWTGVYTGEVVLVVETQLPGRGPLVLRCEGPLDFVVSLDGQQAPVEDGGCTIAVLGQAFPATYAIEIIIDPAGLAHGTVDFAFETPVGAFELPLEWVGAFYDDRFSAGLEGTVDIPFVGAADVSGRLQAVLVDRYVDPDAG